MIISEGEMNRMEKQVKAIKTYDKTGANNFNKK